MSYEFYQGEGWEPTPRAITALYIVEAAGALLAGIVLAVLCVFLVVPPFLVWHWLNRMKTGRRR